MIHFHGLEPGVGPQAMVLVGLGATVLSFGGHFGAYTYVAPLLEYGAGFGPQAVGWLLRAFGFGTVVGMIGGSWIIASDVEPILLAAAGGVGLSILILAAAGGSSLATVCCIPVWGVCYGMLPLALQTWMFTAFPKSPERVTSLYVCVAQSSIGGGALAGGKAFDAFGPHAPFWCGGIAACSTIPLVLLATRRVSSK